MIRIINRAPELIKYRPIYSIFNPKDKHSERLMQRATFNFSKIGKKKIEIKPPSINISKFN
jgi:hypothetical protein